MNKEDLLLEQWKTASELHRHMDNLIWQHFHHFITVNGILLSALALIWSRIASSAVHNDLAFASTVVSFFGLNFSVVWYFTHRRQQAYHRYRGAQAKETEKELTVDNERVLDLYDKTLGELNKKDKERLQLQVGKLDTLFPTLSLVLWLPFSLSIAWLIATIYFLTLWLRL